MKGGMGLATHLGLATLGRLLTLGVAITLGCNLVVLPSLIALHASKPRVAGSPEQEAAWVRPTHFTTSR